VSNGEKHSYTLYGQIISSAIISTNLLMYFFFFMRKVKLEKGQRSDDTYNMESRAAGLLSTLFAVFLFGPGMPYIFLYCWFQHFLIYFADRYLLVYYFKVVPNHTNVLIKFMMYFLAFGPLLTLVMAWFMMFRNALAFGNIPYLRWYTNDFILYIHNWPINKYIMWITIVIFTLVCLFIVYFHKKIKTFVGKNLGDISFISELGEHDRRLWLAEETY